MKKRIALICEILAVAGVAASSVFAGEPSPTFEARNVDFSAGGARVAASGRAIFTGDFSSPDAWAERNDYESKLEFQFGAGDDSSELVVTRTKPIGEGEAESRDTAWSVATGVLPIDAADRGKAFVLRMTARASKRCEGGGEDGKTWRGGLSWRDERGEQVAETPFLFSCGQTLSETRLDAVVPENASGVVVRIGFDIPNIEPGESVVVSSLSLEIVDPDRPYGAPGEFLSNIYRGVADFEAFVDAPEGTEARVAILTAPDVAGAPGEFEESESFVPQGAVEIAAPFFRYRVTLTPSGVATPVLKMVRIGGAVERNWTTVSDNKPPRARLIGARSQPNPDPQAPVAFALQDASLIATNSVKVAIDDEDATDRFKRIIDGIGLDAEDVAFGEEGAPNYAPGLHKVVVSASDVYGNAVDATRYFLVGAAPATPRVTLRDDGTTLIDGEPFFPVGIYGVMEREFNGFDIDEAFRGLKDAGFNFAHSYAMPRDDRFLAAAEKYGFKLWSVARFPDERFVEKERFSPAIIAWYLGDDTSYNTTPEELDDYFFSVKAVDPTRLTVQADPISAESAVSNYRPYVAGTDAFLPEIYPVRKEGAESGFACVAQTVMDVRRSRADAVDANDGPKAIWPIIQYFQGWGWERFPTYPELRAMSFAALAAGANGITWYTYGGTVEPEKKKFNYGVTTSPERWQNISTIATQISELAPVLLQPTDPDDQPTPTVLSGPTTAAYNVESIVCLLKRLEGKTYLLAVNTTPEEVAARFSFPTPQPDGTPETLYDEKDRSKATFSDGALAETFEPFGVRIWRW